MGRLGEMWRRLVFLLRWRRFDAELEEEMRHHLEMKAADIGRGDAVRRFGNAALLKDQSRDAWGWGPVERAWQDARYALRMLRKNAGFTAVALLTLGIGIGASTVVFTVVHAVLMAPLPYQQPERLVRLLGRKPRWGTGMSAPDVADIRAQNSVFAGVAVSGFHQADISGPGEPERVRGSRVSGDLFGVLGVMPLLGRPLEPADERPGAPAVVVLSYGMWQRRFAGSPDAVGSTITMDTDSRTIVGVMPRWFQFPDDTAQYWIPLGDVPIARQRSLHVLNVVARLRPGATIAQARSEVRTIAARLERAYPAADGGWSADAVALSEQLVGGVRPALLILLGAVAMVLLVACANVANLLLARGVQRGQEMAVRAALGAGRRRLVRLLLVESLLLSLAGGALGGLLAVWGVYALTPFYPPQMPRVAEIQIDKTVMAFTGLVSLATAVVVGLFPALRVSHTDLNAALKAGARTRGPRTGRARAALVIAQVALAMVLLACSGVLIRSFLLRTRVNGFRPDDVLIVELPQLAQGHLPAVLDRIRSIPGVESAGATTSFAYTRMMGIEVKVTGAKADQAISATVEIVTSGYFQTLRIALRKGRTIDAGDFSGRSPVAVVNEALARRYFAGAELLGRQIVLATRPKETLAPIVGVVGDVPMFASEREAEPALYLPYQPSGFVANFEPDSIAVRTSGRPERLVGAVRSVIRTMEPRTPIVRMQTMRADLARMVASEWFYTVMLGLFAGMGLLLAVLGVYGVVSFAVSLRTHEIGVRMALGASYGDVAREVLREGLLLAGGGAAIGTVASLAATRVLISTNLLFGVKPRDPLTFALVPAVLLTAAVVASWGPARRATKVDPVVALRYE